MWEASVGSLGCAEPPERGDSGAGRPPRGRPDRRPPRTQIAPRLRASVANARRIIALTASTRDAGNRNSTRRRETLGARPQVQPARRGPGAGAAAAAVAPPRPLADEYRAGPGRRAARAGEAWCPAKTHPSPRRPKLSGVGAGRRSLSRPLSRSARSSARSPQLACRERSPRHSRNANSLETTAMFRLGAAALMPTEAATTIWSAFHAARGKRK